MISGSADKEKMDQLKVLIDNCGLSAHSDELLKRVQKSIGIVPQLVESDKDIALAQSKFGGRPDVPWGFKWPVYSGSPLSFVAQINFAEMQHLSKEFELPEAGVLSFFYDNNVWGFDPRDKDGFKVYFFSAEDGVQLNLSRSEGSGKEEPYEPYKPCRIGFESFYSLPAPNRDGEDSVDDLLGDGLRENYYQLLNDMGFHHRMFGYSEPVQNEMESECQLVTNGIYCGDVLNYEDPKITALLKNNDQWQLLLQLNSDEDFSDMMWGDVGCLYYWIKKEDFKQRRFDNSWIVMQCG